MPTTIQPATRQKWRVLWYEVQKPRALFRNGETASLPTKPLRRQVFHVDAFTHDKARAAALDYTRTRGVQVVAINATTRPHEFVIYTEKRKS
jgi:hypothetical protein